MAMSQQPIPSQLSVDNNLFGKQFATAVINAHIGKRAYISSQSQIIKKSWLKTFDRVQSSKFNCASSGISILAN